MFDKITSLDEKFTQALRMNESSKASNTVAAFMAHSGDSWFILIALFLIWLFTGGMWHQLSALMAGSVILLAILILAVKFLIHRKRPDGQWGAIYRNTDPHSFPSGHAARTAMLSMLAFMAGPAWLGWILAAWVPLVCLARVGLRVHYLSDILAGIAIGLLFGWGMAALLPTFVSLFPVIFL